MTLPALKPEILPVLLIEDEPAVMSYVCAALERNGLGVARRVFAYALQPDPH